MQEQQNRSEHEDTVEHMDDLDKVVWGKRDGNCKRDQWRISGVQTHWQPQAERAWCTVRQEMGVKGGGARVLHKCETKRKEGRSVLELGALHVSRQVAASPRGPLGYGCTP
jgi:hypothetical protein